MLTNTMEQNPFWKDNIRLVGQETSYLLRQPKFQYCVRKTPSQDSVLSQKNPFYDLTSHIFKVHFNNVFQFMWFLPFMFSE